MKIHTRGKQAFNVPNTPLGRMFLYLLKKFRNRGWHYHARGRGPRKDLQNHYDCPQEHADWMAVYLENRGTPERPLPGGYVQGFMQTLEAFNNHDNSSFGSHTHLGTDSANINGGTLSINEIPVHDQGASRYWQTPVQSIQMQVAEWSNPISAGDTVAVGNDGKAYAAYPHGITVGDPLGTALANSDGLIGTGEATVQIQLPESVGGQVGGPYGALPVLNAEVPAQAVVWPQPKEEDDVELAPEELAMLEGMLNKMLESGEVGHWGEEDQEIFTSLWNKLID